MLRTGSIRFRKHDVMLAWITMVPGLTEDLGGHGEEPLEHLLPVDLARLPVPVGGGPEQELAGGGRLAGGGPVLRLPAQQGQRQLTDQGRNMIRHGRQLILA